MTEEIGKGPEDLNSNNNGETTASYAASYVSNTSSQNDADFIQDNSEYQWFLDYGYREGVHHQVSVLSSLSESYARGLLTSAVDAQSCGLYDDLARNLDANLAEVDMENFCAEDIHSLLNTLPTMCDLQKGAESNSQGEMFASISGLTSSLMGKFDFDSSLSPHSSSQGDDSAGSIDTMSICKSELLFSPVKESAVPGTINFSVDSLDSDIMLTCQANKDNYTIAFEGSTTMASEDSVEYKEDGDSEATSTDSNNWSRTSRMMNPALAAVLGAEQRLLNTSLTPPHTVRISKNGCGRPNCKQVLISSQNNMARSDSTFTTWSKLKKPDTENPLEPQQLSRHPSGNNNTTQETEEESHPESSDQTTVKSRSLPNLARQQRQQQRIRQQLRASVALSSTSSIESSCVKLYDVRCNGSPLTSSGASSCSGGKSVGGINLVRLFMKQRSGSGTDHSSYASDGWDSDSCIRSATGPMRRNNNEWQSNGGISQSCRGKQVFRSCQGMDMTQNDNSVEECQCLPEESMTKEKNQRNPRFVESSNSGQSRRNNGGWVRGEEMTDCSTCTFEDSLYRLEDGGPRTHEQIAEEDVEGPSEHSESVEKVSESISKINSMARDSTIDDVLSCDDTSNYSSHHEQVHSLNKTEGNLSHCQRYNVNNNNSLETEDISSDDRRRGSVGNCCCCGCENKVCRKLSSTQCQLPLINRSMQTSCMLDVLSKATLQEIKLPNKNVSQPERSDEATHAERKEKQDNQTEKETKPVYVYYPNYALPDLGFLKEKKPSLDLTKVYLRPLKFSAAAKAGNVDLLSKIPVCLRQPKKAWKQQRPFSCNDMENLRKKGFKHVQDWDSLTALLPKEYRELLADVPEVLKYVDAKTLKEQEHQPLFCASPPAKNRYSHPGCECTNGSCASSTNTQPSSGYRGSSTLLSDSSTQSPNYNPLYVYRYDSVSSEASLIGTEKKPAASSHAPPLPKRSISLPIGKDGKKHTAIGDVSPQTPAPPRPPLPKSILRTGVDSDGVAVSKMRKEAANKRFSMFELGAGQNSNAASKRSSLQEPYYLRGHGDRKNQVHDDDNELVAENLGHHHPQCSHAEFEDVLRLSDYIHLSTAGMSDASFESEWDDDKMARLRLQVSKFLSTGSDGFNQTNQQSSSKAVSFGTTKQRPSSSAGDVKTPPNSPNVSALLGNHRQYQCKIQQPLSDLPIREEDPGESSADEQHSVPLSTSHKKPDLESKKALITAVSDAVEEVISHFAGASTPGECARLGDSALTPPVANSIIGTLCPALYAVLSDGLLPNIATAFGDISNSVWQVVEASAQQGHMTRSLNELVLRLNSEDVFSEGLLKFNAFVFGLLNVRSVDAWMGYLRTRESILCKHYSPKALLVLSLRGGPTYRALTDSLLAALKPLALLPFHLDLLFECRQLHHSLQRLGAAAATSPTSLLRLVRSIQNSVGQLAIAEETLLRGDSENPLPNFVEQCANTAPLLTPIKRTSRTRQLRRPRSCVDPSMDMVDPSNSSTLRKRWSGVQLNSKLSQALDRLLAEDAEEDFSDSLNAATPATPSTLQQRLQSDQSTSDDSTLAGHCSEMDHTDTELSDRSGAAAKARRAHALGVGGKFRRLQMKWEKLSGSGCESRDPSRRPSPESSPTKTSRARTSLSGSSRTSPAMSPVKSGSRTSLHSPGSASSSLSSTSRIPRPVTSPVRPPTGIPLPRGAVSPTLAQALAQPPVRRPSLPPSQGKRTGAGSARTSRADLTEPRSPATRPSSLPYSPIAPTDGTGARRSSQRRANSASVSRPAPAPAPPGRKARPVPRFVRTIKHQLASDSGHLSFSTGERLSLVLEVDEDWLLCCKGDRKGLVRRSAVVATQDHTSRF